MRVLLIVACMAIGVASFAQDPADIFHKTIDLDSINQIDLDVYGEDQIEIKSWPGDDILVETSVKIVNGKPFMLKFFKEKERYDLVGNISGDRMQLISKDKTRKKVNSNNGTVLENVAIVVYMPEEFDEAGGNTYRRRSK